MGHRSYSWEKLDESFRPLAQQSGLTYFERLRDGEIAAQPIMQTIGWRIETVEHGRLGLRLLPGEHLYHAGGLVHGGVIATVLDSAMSGAAMSTLEQGQACTTTQLSIHFVAGVRPSAGELHVDGSVKHRGGTMITMHGTVSDGAGRLYAHATASCLILAGRTIS
jgi:uncharacterized protein (TIGR00369 family)